MTKTIRILGIDPGTRQVGYGVIEQQSNSLRWLASGCIHAKGNDVSTRLVILYRGLREVIQQHSPQMAAVETVFAGNNPRTAIAIGEGRGVAVLAAAEQGLEVRGYEPMLVKKAVSGTGRADKERVRAMVRIILSLTHPAETDHESDALALAITHAHYLTTEKMTGISPHNSRGSRTRRRPLPDLILRQLPPGVA